MSYVAFIRSNTAAKIYQIQISENKIFSQMRVRLNSSPSGSAPALVPLSLVGLISNLRVSVFFLFVLFCFII